MQSPVLMMVDNLGIISIQLGYLMIFLSLMIRPTLCICSFFLPLFFSFLFC
jgi:hypothetical protein